MAARTTDASPRCLRPRRQRRESRRLSNHLLLSADRRPRRRPRQRARAPSRSIAPPSLSFPDVRSSFPTTATPSAVGRPVFSVIAEERFPPRAPISHERDVFATNAFPIASATHDAGGVASNFPTRKTVALPPKRASIPAMPALRRPGANRPTAACTTSSVMRRALLRPCPTCNKWLRASARSECPGVRRA